MKARTDTVIRAYIEKEGLEATTDPSLQEPVYRRPGFDGISTPSEVDAKVGGALKKARVEKKLSRTEVALLFGSAEAVYGRYENGVTRFHVSQFLQLCEVLRIFPDELLYEAAPHLWGDTPEKAERRRRASRIIEQMPEEPFETFMTALEAMAKLSGSGLK